VSKTKKTKKKQKQKKKQKTKTNIVRSTFRPLSNKRRCSAYLVTDPDRGMDIICLVKTKIKKKTPKKTKTRIGLDLIDPHDTSKGVKEYGSALWGDWL
jgi:hypothetical protein